jgi:hypothetical protein
MMRRICLSAAFIMIAAPAFAAEVCMDKQPTMPKMPDGRTAPAADVIAASNAVKAYVAASDVYQQCLKEQIDAMEATAKTEKKAADPKVKANLVKLGDDNQESKERLGAAYNAVAAAYRAAHPAPARR